MESLLEAARALDCRGARSDSLDEEISSTVGSLGTLSVFWVGFCAGVADGSITCPLTGVAQHGRTAWCGAERPK